MKKYIKVLLLTLSCFSLMGCSINVGDISSEDTGIKSANEINTTSKFKATLQWEDYENYDLDISALLLGEDNKVLGNSSLIYYNNKESDDSSVTLSSDSRGDSDTSSEEYLEIDTDKIESDINKIVVFVTIYKSSTDNKQVGSIQNGSIKVEYDKDTYIDLSDSQYEESSSIIVGELYRDNNEWKFENKSQGTQDAMEDICSEYGLDTTYN
jgi:tellurium resistance protein TerD